MGLAAISAAILVEGARSTTTPWRYRLALAGLVLVVVAGEGYKLASLYRTVPGALISGDPSGHLARFSANDRISVNDAVAFAQLASADAASTCVLVVGNGSAINYLSGRRQPTRFYYFPVIFRTRPPLPMAERWLALWASDLESANCRYALVAREVHDGWLKAPSPAADSLRQFLDAYAKSGTLGGPDGMVIYRRR